MCIIIDACVIADLNAPSEHGALILKWLLTGGGAMITGGSLTRELAKSSKMQETMIKLRQAGKLHVLKETDVSPLAKKLKSRCHSNDPHVLAVAIASGCRLIFSNDKGLHRDVKNKELLSPAASIYQTKAHAHLLEPCRCSP